MTQTDRVIQYLRLQGEKGLTPLEALDWIGTMRLASRINEAKDRLGPNEVIVTERVTRDGKTFARYVLRERRDGVVQTSLPW